MGGEVMRRAVCLAVLCGLWLAACGPASSDGTTSQAAANASALKAIEDLARYQAQSASTPAVTGFAVVGDTLTTSTARVYDSRGHVLTVTPAPGKAWVVEMTAPPQGMWGSISALAEVDSTSGVVAGTGLWAAPYEAPVKPAG